MAETHPPLQALGGNPFIAALMAAAEGGSGIVSTGPGTDYQTAGSTTVDAFGNAITQNLDGTTTIKDTKGNVWYIDLNHTVWLVDASGFALPFDAPGFQLVQALDAAAEWADWETNSPSFADPRVWEESPVSVTRGSTGVAYAGLGVSGGVPASVDPLSDAGSRILDRQPNAELTDWEVSGSTIAFVYRTPMGDGTFAYARQDFDYTEGIPYTDGPHPISEADANSGNVFSSGITLTIWGEAPTGASGLAVQAPIGPPPSSAPQDLPSRIENALGIPRPRTYGEAARLGLKFGWDVAKTALNPLRWSDAATEAVGLGRPTEWAVQKAIDLAGAAVSGETNRLYPDNPYLQGVALGAFGLPLTPEQEHEHDQHFATGEMFSLADLPVVGPLMPTTKYDAGLWQIELIEKLPMLAAMAGSGGSEMGGGVESMDARANPNDGFGTTVFRHGTPTIADAENIVANGGNLRVVDGAPGYAGFDDGSFFTFREVEGEVPRAFNRAADLAVDKAQLIGAAGDSAVVRIELPNPVVDALQREGLIFTGNAPGGGIQTAFSPRAFEYLNGQGYITGYEIIGNPGWW